MFKALVRSPGVQALGARAVAGYLRLALRTTRWTVDGAEHLAPFLDGAPAVVAFWHECLPLMPALWGRAAAQRGPRGAPIHVLVSRHNDGRFIGEVVRGFGVALVHGSSAIGGKPGRTKDRGGTAAARTLAAVLAEGGQVAITPDGPRGPRRQAARGAAQLAARAGVPLVPVAAQTTRGHRLATWDRMVLPLPGARGALVCGAPLRLDGDWATVQPRIEAALNAASDRADALCAA